jgi:EAL domain-containing protein (putative c-di-GMP-specific phosphodiesterase class I)/ActR/RegA family two-component response regulator
MSPAQPIRVLIADDDAQVREILAALIDSEPSLELTDAVGDAEQAIMASARRPPTVAVLDVRMPGGGEMAARGIKRVSPETRVLALTASDDRATVLGMLAAGADGYLVKGVSVDTIVAAIVAAAAGQGSLSAEVTSEVIQELSERLQTHWRSEEHSRSREERVRQALEHGVLSMVFQPICTLAGGMVGAEALARFDCEPRQGPDRWFAEAGSAGLRLELELAAAGMALDALPALPDALDLAINVSPATLASTAFLALLEQSDGARVVVEITEHAPIDDYETLRDSLATLRALGARVAIDDAGAGFASLRHILRLAPDFIKLDRTLVNGIDADRSLQALAAGLIAFARTIDAVIIAEGIERAEEVETLVELGVELGQGYLFARPAPLPLPRRILAVVAEASWRDRDRNAA